MQFLTHSECVEWAKCRGYPLAETLPGWITLQRNFTSPPFHLSSFKLPLDSGKKAHLAKAVYSLYDGSPEVLLWLGAWDVWPSSQHRPLFERLRESLGEKQPIGKTPGHLVSLKETDDAISIILISLLFIWDCHILSDSGRDAAFLSHDEYGWFGSLDPVVTEKTRVLLK